MRNPYFHIAAGATTPTVDAVLFGSDSQPVNLQGATVTFQLFNTGGTLRFAQTATVLDLEQARVRHAWSGGQVPTTPGRYLARFRVTYSNLDVQNFPSNRHIEIIVT